jgi:hypothetical protein
MGTLSISRCDLRRRYVASLGNMKGSINDRPRNSSLSVFGQLRTLSWRRLCHANTTVLTKFRLLLPSSTTCFECKSSGQSMPGQSMPGHSSGGHRTALADQFSTTADDFGLLAVVHSDFLEQICVKIASRTEVHFEIGMISHYSYRCEHRSHSFPGHPMYGS